MFRIERRDNAATRTFKLMELVFHATVRNIRKGQSSGGVALFMNVLQTLIFISAFALMLLAVKTTTIRGDFILYIMTGVFLFMTHVKAMGAVVGSEGPASPMMKHAPMNTAIAIAAAALSSLYLQTLSMFIVLCGVHVAWHPIEISQPGGAAVMFLLAWFTGVAIGTVLLAIKPWAPNFVQIANTIYSRLNMVASGKMFVANTLPTAFLPFFDWNPLFHAIDQARGFTFINYNPHYTTWTYPVICGLALLTIGMMGEFYTRRQTSLSWFAAR
ncbi:ABC transporter permease [uncultured Jannaschia sp.]|uniref:ABC transporter permease n=1 Tax=uncultured Jannaschia sp. TaxID=293347 RepID=UPI00263050F2|nr:ABC transporter permease [uncultured Jannaschia sp.]